MDNNKERFVHLKESDSLKPLTKIRKEALHKENGKVVSVSVGDEFKFKGRKFKVRKITKKDIVCRPADWNQGSESTTD